MYYAKNQKIWQHRAVFSLYNVTLDNSSRCLQTNTFFGGYMWCGALTPLTPPPRQRISRLSETQRSTFVP